MLCKTCKRFLTESLRDEVNRNGGIGLHSKTGVVPYDFHRVVNRKDNTPVPYKHRFLPDPLTKRRHLDDGCFFCQSLLENGLVLNPSERPSYAGLDSILLSMSRWNRIVVSVSGYRIPQFRVYSRQEPLDESSAMAIMAFPGTAQETRKIYQSIGVSPDSRSDCTSAATKLWRYWYGRCTQFHSKCRAIADALPHFTPDRLVEILASERDNHKGLQWRVVSQSDFGHVPYVTLSHCWGTSRYIKLTEKTYAKLQSRGWDPSILPKTYQDSLVVAQSLGFKYIWIDSLCIIQDNGQDWLNQSAVMGRIYQSSACNIAATWADDSQKGCFSNRKPALSSLATVMVRQTADGKPTEFQLVDARGLRREIDEAPLNSRGWVLQERYLSRSQLSFAKSQVYWECHELVASEQFPAGLPGEAYFIDRPSWNILTKPTVDFEDESEMREAWRDLVNSYSGMKLTHITDRDVALSGVAGHVRSLNNDEYLAGLWRKDLGDHLCWFAESGYLLPSRRSRSPPTTSGAREEAAPSWSWLSIDSRVSCDERHKRRPSGTKRCAEVITAKVHSRHPSRLHSFVSGELVLNGIFLPCSGRRRTDEFSWQFQLQTDSQIPEKSRKVLDGTPFTLAVAVEKGRQSARAIRYMGSGGGPGSLQTLRGEKVRETPNRGTWNQKHDIVSFLPDTDSIPELDLNVHQTCQSVVFFLMYIRHEFGFVSGRDLSAVGLVLRKLEGPKDLGKYIRIGIFESTHTPGNFGASALTRLADQLRERTPKEDWKRGLVALDHPDIAPLVRVVTIV